jgi:hypothetical protein
MDARTGVQRQQPSKPLWVVAGEPSSSAENTLAVADQAAANRPQPHLAAGPSAAGEQLSGAAHGEDRRSLDPLRSTDRYRLVMPYAAEV